MYHNFGIHSSVEGHLNLLCCTTTEKLTMVMLIKIHTIIIASSKIEGHRNGQVFLVSGKRKKRHSEVDEIRADTAGKESLQTHKVSDLKEQKGRIRKIQKLYAVFLPETKKATYLDI